MRLRSLSSALVLFTLLLAAPLAQAADTPAEQAADNYAAQQMASHPVHGNLPDYSLPPDKLIKSQHLSKVSLTIHFADEVWGIAQLVLLLWLGVIAWMRDRAVRFSANRWLQCFAFFLLYTIAGFLLELPVALYGHNLELEYGLSIQRWGSWFGDQAKTFALSWIVGGLLVMLLFYIIRRAPRRWWLIFWAASIPIVLFGVFAAPYINLLYNTFEPLQKNHSDLVAQLEKVAAKGQMDIPPDRMFLMKASEKETTLNAYVTGFGSSKRVVVWDTSLMKGTPDQVLFIFGHESGHYVLGHIVRGLVLSLAGLFVAIGLGYLFVGWALARFGTRWRIPVQADWGALAVLLLAFSLLSAVQEPVVSFFSRQQEHAADVYGQEAIHGIVADPQTTAKTAFDVLGENSYDDPNPNPFIQFWMYDHPAIGRRAAFAEAYNPWLPGMSPRYFKASD